MRIEKFKERIDYRVSEDAKGGVHVVWGEHYAYGTRVGVGDTEDEQNLILLPSDGIGFSITVVEMKTIVDTFIKRRPKGHVVFKKEGKTYSINHVVDRPKNNETPGLDLSCGPKNTTEGIGLRTEMINLLAKAIPFPTCEWGGDEDLPKERAKILVWKMWKDLKGDEGERELAKDDCSCEGCCR